MPLKSTLRLLHLNKESLVDKRQKVRKLFKSFGKDGKDGSAEGAKLPSKEGTPLSKETTPTPKEATPTPKEAKPTPKEAAPNLKEVTPTPVKDAPATAPTANSVSGNEKPKPSSAPSSVKEKPAKAIVVEADTEMNMTVFEPVKNSKPAICVEKGAKLKWKDTTTMSVEASEKEDKKDDPKPLIEVVKGGSSDRTIFEPVKAEFKPAIVYEKPANLKWKVQPPPQKAETPDQSLAVKAAYTKLKPMDKIVDDAEAAKIKPPQKPKEVEEKSEKKEEKKDVATTPPLADPETAKVQPPKPKETDEKKKKKDAQFIMACKIMIQIRQCNVLESVLCRDDNLIVRKFFQEQMENPTPKVIGLLHKAMELCYERIMLHSDEYDLYLDSQMMEFLRNKEKAKAKLLDVLMTIPDLLPLMWGGKAVVFQICEDKENAEQIYLEVVKSGRNSKHTSLNEEADSPWAKMLKDSQTAEQAMMPEAKTQFELTKKPAGLSAKEKPKETPKSQSKDVPISSAKVETQKKDITTFFKVPEVKKAK